MDIFLGTVLPSFSLTPNESRPITTDRHGPMPASHILDAAALDGLCILTSDDRTIKTIGEVSVSTTGGPLRYLEQVRSYGKTAWEDGVT